MGRKGGRGRGRVEASLRLKVKDYCVISNGLEANAIAEPRPIYSLCLYFSDALCEGSCRKTQTSLLDSLTFTPHGIRRLRELHPTCKILFGDSLLTKLQKASKYVMSHPTRLRTTPDNGSSL